MNNIENYIKPNWPAPQNIHAFTTTRHHGFSKKPFSSLNLADHVGDDPKAVLANRNKLKVDSDLPTEPIWLKQTHSTKVICLDNYNSNEPPNADAAYTTMPNKICAVMTADCLPLLISTKNGLIVAAIHAGWQGMVAGIIESTLDELSKITKLQDLLVWLGPAIGPNAFFIKDDVRQQFLSKDPQAKLAMQKQDSDTWSLNIYTIAKQRLQERGITYIYGGDHCTYTEEQLFFSYRRDKQVTGRIASLIYRQPFKNEN